MTVDSLDPVGIYMGTRSGQLFGSRDEGKNWHKILDGLPSVVCVRAAMVEDPARSQPVKASEGFAAHSLRNPSSRSRKSSAGKKR